MHVRYFYIFSNDRKAFEVFCHTPCLYSIVQYSTVKCAVLNRAVQLKNQIWTVKMLILCHHLQLQM